MQISGHVIHMKCVQVAWNFEVILERLFFNSEFWKMTGNVLNELVVAYLFHLNSKLSKPIETFNLNFLVLRMNAAISGWKRRRDLFGNSMHGLFDMHLCIWFSRLSIDWLFLKSPANQKFDYFINRTGTCNDFVYKSPKTQWPKPFHSYSSVLIKRYHAFNSKCPYK